ncbi:hypothetical protein J6590_012591 [Homalodisca vitripennis]|nr:hypothetical protein J6590_012591 [Homalodisca vitripennis]
MADHCYTHLIYSSFILYGNDTCDDTLHLYHDRISWPPRVPLVPNPGPWEWSPPRPAGRSPPTRAGRVEQRWIAGGSCWKRYATRKDKKDTGVFLHTRYIKQIIVCCHAAKLTISGRSSVSEKVMLV